MRLSVVIISWNSLDMLHRCIHALMPLLARDDTELVWVDNGSTDGAASHVATVCPDSVRIILPHNCGVARARNEGIRHSQGRYVLFLDDDTEAHPDAVDALTAYADAHPHTGITAPALRDSSGRLQDSFKPYPGLWQKIRNVAASRLHIRHHTRLPQSVVHPTYVIGACQLIRREVFDSIGLLDEDIFYGPEDADFCIRAYRAGWSVDYVPSVTVMHHWRRITSRSLTSTASKAHIRGLLHLWKKHGRI